MTSDLCVGLCPGEVVQMGGVTAQTGDLKFLSFQTDRLILTDRHGGRKTQPCRQTGRQVERQVTEETSRNGIQDRQTDRLVDRQTGLTGGHEQVDRSGSELPSVPPA